MTTEFFMAMKPPTCTHQEKKARVIYKDGKPVPSFYEPAELQTARAKLEAHLAKHIPNKPYEKAVRCVVKWCFPIVNNKHRDGEWKATAPDTHNMNKLLFDVMEDLGYWKNDALVASEIIEKFWADKPGIYIRIERL